MDHIELRESRQHPHAGGDVTGREPFRIALFDRADGSNVRRISYRPGAVIHSTEQAGFGDKVVEFVFEPFKTRRRTVGWSLRN